MSGLLTLRQRALGSLPRRDRARLVSLDRRGLQEIELEIELMHKIFQVDGLRFRELLLAGRQSLRDVFTALTAGKVLLRVVLVLVLWRWVQRRRTPFFDTLRRRVEREGGAARHPARKALLEIGEASAPWAVFLLGVASLSWALGPAMRSWKLVSLPLLLAAVYGVYRLGVGLLTVAVFTAARRVEVQVSARHRAKVERSVRWTLGVLALAVVLPLMIEIRIGPGFLYLAARRGLVWIAGLAFVALAVSWRRDLVDAFVAAEGHRSQAELVRRTRDRWTGILLLPALLLWLAGRTLVAVGKNFTVGMDALRRGSNFLFRRQVEKEAARSGYAEGELDRLPEAVVRALDERITPEDWDVFDEVPGLERARLAVADWRRGEGAGVFLVTGETGMGRAAWLDRLQSVVPEARRLTLERRILDPGELRRWAWERLGPGGDPDDLGSTLSRGDRRVLVLDRAENLFLASLDGYRCLEELDRLADETGSKVFWLASAEQLALRHLRALGKARLLTRSSVELAGWEPWQLRKLLRARLASAGLEVSYRELLRGEPGGNLRQLERQGERAFVNLLWEFAGGNPRVALHYFLRSLVSDAKGALKVRLFRKPPVDELVDLGDEALFLLAALVRHRGLSRDEAIRATACPPTLVRTLAKRLVEVGVIGEEDGRWEIETGWLSSVLRLLRRRNVLYS